MLPVNKPKMQGTAWESELVNRAQDRGLMADRLAEGGTNDPGDVWLVDSPHSAYPDIAVVAWKRLTGDGSSRRTPDGERDVIVIATDDFLYLLAALSHVKTTFGIVVECKARQNLNVTRTLANTRRKLANWKARR